jgi:WD40 repeat protein
VSGKFHEADINVFALHHERPLVVSGDIEGKVYYSHYQTGEIGTLMGTHADSVESIAFSKVSPICVSAGIDNFINIYDLNTNEIRFKINPTGEYGGFTKLLFSSVKPHILLASSTLGDFFLLDVRDGRAVKQLKGHAAPINDFIEIPQYELVVTGGDDNCCLVFSITEALA